MFKRASLILLCLALVLGLTACGGSDTSTPSGSNTTPTTSAPGTSAPQKEWMKDLNFNGREFLIGLGGDWGPKAGESEGSDRALARIEELQKTYNCKITYQAVPNVEAMLQATALSGEYLVDICYAQSYNLVPGYAHAGLVHAVSDYNVFDFTEDKWNTGMIDYCTYRGKVYAVPEGYSDLGAGVFFNKTLFEENSLQSPYELYEADTWTWQAMVDYATALTQDTDGDGVDDQWGLAIDADYYPFLFSNNVHLLEEGEDGKFYYNLNSTQAVEALEFFFEQSHSDINAPWLGDTFGSRIDPFVKGKIGMLVGEWWYAPTYMKEMEDEFGWMPFPKGPSATKYELRRGSCSCFVIPTPVEKPEEAMMMYDLLFTHYEDDVELGFSSLLSDDESLAIITDAISQRWTSYDWTSRVTGLGDITRQAIDTAWGGEVSTKTAVDSVADAAQQLIDESLNKEAASTDAK